MKLQDFTELCRCDHSGIMGVTNSTTSIHVIFGLMASDNVMELIITLYLHLLA